MAKALDIERWDLDCEFNNTDHRTELNGVDRLIVRRGQEFTISLYLRSGGYKTGVSALDIVAETGPQPYEQYGTRASFGLSAKIDKSRWSATVTSPPGDMVALSICSAPDAPIGRYTLTLGRSGRIDFILLFNPWCRDDAVYMDDKKSLEEYVLSQDGLIFQGSVHYPVAVPWNFGQFESGILDICLRVLDMNPKCQRNPGKDCSGRRNPIYVSRVLSAMVNCNGDKGVVRGNWSGDYEGGVSPLSWKGSASILHNWDTRTCQAVCYGQCWVFAAVACTISRALGIPCRTITNYVSAHDVNGDLMIERNIDEKGRPISSKEMVWNYHCWVESWMTRPDLKSEFNGWQVSDPTPQEKSEGVYCCGPIPVKAIKEGELKFKYDAKFVYAEVNADVKDYKKESDGSTTTVSSTTAVGQKISTKKVGVDAREDITHLYKYPEGSQEERNSFNNANHQVRVPQKDQDLHLAIKVGTDMRKGCDFEVFTMLRNKTRSGKNLRLIFDSYAVSYNGHLGEHCGFEDLFNFELSPGGEKRVPLRLKYCEYGGRITEDNLIRLRAQVYDYGTGEHTVETRVIVLENPEIEVRILGEPKKNRKLAAEISLKNPLPEPLENCFFSIEGANLTGGRTISERLDSPVGPGGDAKVKIHFTPSHCGLRKLMVDFNSSKLCHVKGYKNVIIAK